MNGTRKLIATTPLAERFWPKVDKTAGPSGCWPFTGRVNPYGYGRIGLGRSSDGTAYAHRVAYTLTVGAIPPGLVICHRCDNPPCCNPAHLFLGDMKDNTDDMMAKGRGRHRAFRGEDHSNAKLTTADVLTIRARAHERRVDVARDYGVTPELISSIVLRKSWKHVAEINATSEAHA